MLSSANFFPPPPPFLWPAGRCEHLLWLVGARGSVVAKISGKSHQLAEALPGNRGHRRSPFHPPSYFKPICRCVIPPHPQICSVLHIFVLKFSAPCWKLPSVSLDCVMSFIYYFFAFFPPQEFFRKAMSESLERPSSFYAYHHFAFPGVGGLEPRTEAFRAPPLYAPAAPLSSCPSSKQGPTHISKRLP